MAESPDLPRTMKAQFLDAYNTPYTLRSVPLPTLEESSPHDILIKVDTASYCHTDAVLAAGQLPPFPSSFPHIGCHEFAGTVVSVPPGSNAKLRPGDRVGVPGRAFHTCGTCFECRAGVTDETDADADGDPPGYSVYCPHAGNLGISAPGGFAEYAVVDDRQVAPLPEGMGAVDAAVLMCAGVTVYAALKRCRLKPGQRVGVMGCGGGLGHLGLQFALAMGLRVVGIDNADGPLRLAREVVEGRQEAAMIVDARTENAGEVVTEIGQQDGKQEPGEMGLDAVVILPESQKAFDYGVALLKNHGRCVVVSFPEKGFHVSARDLVFRDISVVGSLVGSNRTLREMLRFAAEYRVRARIRIFRLSDLNDLVAEYHKGQGGKLVVDMTLPDRD
ncbi:putative alcohol dehydrogenase protein [Achaetomium macrosporum]|uniref:Alcohol dehydrogenase protein n=1 Tax=Achaetomium macrosporum TaxID=79813 RepID=A0AAN7CCI0_9PEZI|nr:putative alcohol dehydrogenase protein [Achaetomium macrosporum]